MLRLNDFWMTKNVRTTTKSIMKNSLAVMALQFTYLRINSSQIVNLNSPTALSFSIFLTMSWLTNQCPTNVSKQSREDKLHITGVVLFWWSNLGGLFCATLIQKLYSQFYCHRAISKNDFTFFCWSYESDGNSFCTFSSYFIYFFELNSEKIMIVRVQLHIR